MTTFLVLAVLVGCFSVLVPNILWPIMKTIFGIGNNGQAHRPHDPRGPVPPHRGGGPHRPPPGPNAGHMNPGLRGASQGQTQTHQTTTQGGGRGGYLGFVLPMYAVGVSIYLIFTLFKIFVGGGDSSGGGGRISKDLNPSEQAELSRSIKEMDRYLRMTGGREDREAKRVELSAQRNPVTPPGSPNETLISSHNGDSQNPSKSLHISGESSPSEPNFAMSLEQHMIKREEREKRRKVTEMLFDLKQEATAQGEELQRHFEAAKSGSEEDKGVQAAELQRLQARLENTEKAMARILAAMGHVADATEGLLSNESDQTEATPLTLSGRSEQCSQNQKRNLAPQIFTETSSLLPADNLSEGKDTIDHEGSLKSPMIESANLKLPHSLSVLEQKNETVGSVSGSKEISQPISSSDLALESDLPLVRRRPKPARLSAALSSPDRDSLDDATGAAWSNALSAAAADHDTNLDYTRTNSELVGLGIDPEQLRARVLGVDSEIPATEVQCLGIKLENAVGESEEDSYDNDSVELDGNGRRDTEMLDSLYDDDSILDDKGVDVELTSRHPIVKENSPVLRTAFTEQEVENLRLRVVHGKAET